MILPQRTRGTRVYAEKICTSAVSLFTPVLFGEKMFLLQRTGVTRVYVEKICTSAVSLFALFSAVKKMSLMQKAGVIRNSTATSWYSSFKQNFVQLKIECIFIL